MSNTNDDIQYEENACLTPEKPLFPALKFSRNATNNVNLKQSMRLAEMFMETIECRIYLNEFEINTDACISMIKNVNICFTNQDNEDGTGDMKRRKKKDPSIEILLGWTERKIDASIININKIFEKRLEKVLEEKEHIIIVVYISMIIVHEIAHLVLRWSGQMNTPRKFALTQNGEADAGRYLIRSLFRFDVASMIEKKHTTDKWTDNMPFIGKTKTNLKI